MTATTPSARPASSRGIAAGDASRSPGGANPTLTIAAGADLLELLSAFAEHHGTTPGTVCDLLIGSRHLARDISAGLLPGGTPRSFTTAAYDRLSGALSGYWPDDLRWPQGIDRPRPIEIDPTRAGSAAERFGHFQTAADHKGGHHGR